MPHEKVVDFSSGQKPVVHPSGFWHDVGCAIANFGNVFLYLCFGKKVYQTFRVGSIVNFRGEKLYVVGVKDAFWLRHKRFHPQQVQLEGMSFYLQGDEVARLKHARAE